MLTTMPIIVVNAITMTRARRREHLVPSEMIEVHVSTSEMELVKAANRTRMKNTKPSTEAMPPMFSNT